MEDQVQEQAAPAADSGKVNLVLSLDATVFLKDLVGRVTLSAKDPNIVRAATVVAEIRQAVDEAVTVIQKT